MKKRNIFIFSLIFILVIGIIIFIFLPKKPAIHKTFNVFGTPRSISTVEFPSDKPKFAAVIGVIKPASVHQQSIMVYQLGDPNRTVLFEKSFYSDEFRGNELTYSFASNSATIIQNGILYTLGCRALDCSLSWKNYYTWDPHQQIFMLDNANHKNEFQQILTKYEELDNNGCSIVGGQILSDQKGLSFTNLYKKFPSAKYYCSDVQGILPANLMVFLQAEKALQRIFSGENIGSGDISDIPL